jgi:hypothetical protein
MTQGEFDVLVRCSKECAEKLMARGIPREQALQMASDMAIQAVQKKYPNGLGQVDVDPIDQFAEKSQAAAAIAPIKAVREAITPWLWVTSLIGFGLGLLNTRRIAKMYSDWRRKSASKTKGARA